MRSEYVGLLVLSLDFYLFWDGGKRHNRKNASSMTLSPMSTKFFDSSPLSCFLRARCSVFTLWFIKSLSCRYEHVSGDFVIINFVCSWKMKQHYQHNHRQHVAIKYQRPPALAHFYGRKSKRPWTFPYLFWFLSYRGSHCT